MNMLASPEMLETPVRNRLAQYAGNALSAVDQFARAPFGYANPPAAMLSDALGVPAVASTLNRLAYGDRLTQGRGQTLQIRPEVVDAGLAVAPIAAKFPRATLGAAGMLAGGVGGDVGGLERAATVWHGTPHKFDTFNSSNIGKGEGAQLYGHGLYFAGEPQVAEEYARKLSKPFAEFDRAPSSEHEQAVSEAINAAIQRAQFDARTNFANVAFDAIANPLRDRLYGNAYAGIKPMPQEQLDRALSMQSAAKSLGRPRISDNGSLYEVDLPDGHISKMLDWDNGGADVWQEAVSKYGSEKKAANALRSQGIPGIKYLDGQSRSVGAGTSNYVVFPGEEKALTILSRNGQPAK